MSRRGLDRHSRRVRPDGHAADPVHRRGSRSEARRGARPGRPSAARARTPGPGRGRAAGRRLEPNGPRRGSDRRHDRLLAAHGGPGDRRGVPGADDPAGRRHDRVRRRLSGETLETAATRIPILISPNMSRAVNLLMRLVGEAARVLGSSADIEIVERHHRTKKDAPSGTALRLAEIAGRAATGRLISSQPGQVGRAPAGRDRHPCACGSPTRPASTRSSSACWARPSS